MKNKKIIVFVCAFSMILSLFASFTVVNAAEKGIVLETTQTSTTEATVTAKYVGFDAGLWAGTIKVSVPADSTVALVTDNYAGTFNDDTSVGYIAYAFAGSDNKATDDGVIFAFTVSLSEALSDDFTCELVDNTAVSEINDESADGYYDYTLVSGAISASTVILADPDATPKPAPFDKPTTDPSVEAPEVKEPVTVSKGVDLTAELNDDGTGATVTAKYVGFDTGLWAGTIKVSVPTDSTVALVTDNYAGTFNDDTSVGYIAYAFAGSDNKATDDNVIFAFTVTFAEALDDEVVFELVDNTAISEINDESADGYYDYALQSATLPAAWTSVYAAIEADNEVALGSLVDSANAVAAEGDDVYAAIEAKKADGSDAVYGEDYAAYYNGVKLTEQQLNNYLAGVYGSVEDAINNIVFTYSNGVTITAQIVKNGAIADEGTTKQTVTPIATSTPKPSNPSISASNVTATVNTNFDISATVLNAKTNPVVTFEIVKNASGDALADDETSAIQIYGTNELSKEVSLASGKYTQKFTANSVGTAYVKISYTDDELNDISKVIKVTVQKASTTTTNNGNGSSSNGSAGGNIATGSNGITTSPSGKIAFVDIDTVVWAQDAILRLVDLGVINGRSDSIFDPNGTVTRAEFAKMVVLAFNLTGGAGATLDYFSDVDMTDWYAPYVVRGYYSGVISGYDDGTFRPNGLITRQEMAAMISRAISAAGKYLPATVAAASFDDAWQIGDWAYDAVTTLQQGGVIDGMGDGTFAPLDNATRAQAAVIIDRAIRYTN